MASVFHRCCWQTCAKPAGTRNGSCCRYTASTDALPQPATLISMDGAAQIDFSRKNQFGDILIFQYVR